MRIKTQTTQLPRKGCRKFKSGFAGLFFIMFL